MADDFEKRVEELERLVDFLGRSVLLLAKLPREETLEVEALRQEIVLDLEDEFGPRPGDPYT